MLGHQPGMLYRMMFIRDTLYFFRVTSYDGYYNMKTDFVVYAVKFKSQVAILVESLFKIMEFILVAH